MSNPIDSSRAVAIQAPVSQNKDSSWRGVVTGSISAMSAVPLIQPMIYFKNRAQAEVAIKTKKIAIKPRFFIPKPRLWSVGKPRTWIRIDFNGGIQSVWKKVDCRLWYRGCTGFAVSFAPTVALQTGAKVKLSEYLDPIPAAVTAGVISSSVVCPAELVLIQQQQTRKNYFATARQVYSFVGVRGFARGLTATAFREGPFAGAYLGLAPKLKKRFQEMGLPEGPAQLIAGVSAGTIAAVFSHPADTVKTRRQSDFSVKRVISEPGFKKIAFKGFKWRFSMVVTATTVIPFVSEKLAHASGKQKT